MSGGAEQLMALYVERGLTLRQVADVLSCSAQKVLDDMRKHGIPRRRSKGTGIVARPCIDCGNPFEVKRTHIDIKRCPECRGSNRWGRDGRKIVGNCAECGTEVSRQESLMRAANIFCDAKCHAIWRSKNVVGDKHPDWKGGREAKNARDEANPQKRLHRRFSNQIWWALEGKKNGHCWEGLVGYSIKDLRSHLEKQFTKGMTWENYGKWHIDHILPVSSFEFDSYEHPEFKRCFSLPNLRPLWAFDNISKNAKRLTLL